MDLTPVRIRGKKRKLFKPVDVTSNLTDPSTQRRQPSNTSRAAKRKKQMATAAMPTLLGLPQELLEIIFLYSMNISLPRASPELGRSLSSGAVTMEFVMRCFFHTVDHKTNIRGRKVTSDPTIQSQLLACRFFTWDFFLGYVHKAHDGYIASRGKIWKHAGVVVPGPKEFDGVWPFRFSKVTFLGFAEGFRIPEKLLHGPWTDDKAKLLYVLVSFNGEIDWAGSMSGETAKEGMDEAIRDGNEYAVAALSVLLGIAQVIDTSLLRYAIIDCGCSLNIVRHLLFNAQIQQESASKENLNFHDPKLWQWAEEHEGKGVLLKDLLRKADKFSLEFYLEGETDWADWKKIVQFPYSGPKFDARTPFSAISREMLVKLYMNYGRRITSNRQRRIDVANEAEEEMAH